MISEINAVIIKWWNLKYDNILSEPCEWTIPRSENRMKLIEEIEYENIMIIFENTKFENNQ